MWLSLQILGEPFLGAVMLRAIFLWVFIRAPDFGNFDVHSGKHWSLKRGHQKRQESIQGPFSDSIFLFRSVP